VPTPIEIRVVTSKQGAGLEETNAALDQISGSVDQANVDLGKFAHSEAFGLSKRQFSEIALSAIVAVDAMGGLDKQAAQLVRTGEQLVSAFAFGGPIGALATAGAIGIGFIASQAQRADEEAKAWIADLTHLNTLLEKQGELAEPAKSISEKLGVTPANAAAMAQMAKESTGYRDALEQISYTYDTKMHAAGLRVRDAYESLTAMQSLAKEGSAADAAEVARLSAEYDASKVALTGLSKEREEAIARLAALTGATKAAKDQDDYYQRSILATAAAYEVASEKAAAYQAALEHLQTWMQDKVTGAVSSALVPTETKVGPDTWDEARKRLEAIATGTPVNKYGDDFANAFHKLNMGAKEAAEGFKDFSLFADPKGITFFKETGGFSSAVDAANQKLDEFVGKETLTQQVSDEVWKNMSADRKKQLADLGITKLTDVDQLALGVLKAPEFDKSLEDIVKQITDTRPKMGVELYWIWPDLPGDKGNKPLEVPAGANPLGAQGGAEIIAYAGGISGMVTRSGLIHVDRGEPVWVGGTRGQVPAPGPTININGATVSRDRDIVRLAREIARQMAKNS
jgi:hypothetical protein